MRIIDVDAHLHEPLDWVAKTDPGLAEELGPPARFMDVARGRAVAIGNVDATKFERTSREAMYADVKRCIDAAARPSGFILSTSCEIPPRSEPEIVQWFMDAAKDYGRYERIFGEGG